MGNTDQLIVATSLQEFGNLIITDYDLAIIAVSDSVRTFTNLELDQLLGSPLEPFLASLWKGDCNKFLRTLQALIAMKIPSQVFSKKIGDQYYYFKLNIYKGFVYIEWEEQHRKHISASRMNKLGFLFDEIYVNNWNFLCKALHKLLQYAHVFVLQVQDTGHSKVIAEHLATNKPGFRGKEFSQDFLPDEVMPYYKSLPYRYVPHFNQLSQKLYSLDTNIHILCSQLAPPPKLHETYLKSLGVSSALFFPLYLDGKFWGMVVAHHYSSKKIDLQQRKLCTFIVQSAMSKFENSFKQDLLNQNQQLLEAETSLKQSLANNRTINCAMVQHMELLTTMVKADGLAIYNQGDVFFHGDTPTGDLFYELIRYLQKNIHKSVFKDYNFRLNHGNHFSRTLPFAGLLYYTIGSDKDYYLVWFRRETVGSVVQLEISEHKEMGNIQTWEEPIYDSAPPWDDADIKFIDRLQQIIHESIVSKAAEKQMLTEELRTLNNELEMFTFSLSHDLKNPLSILKMGLQFLQCNGKNLSTEKKEDWLRNLSGSVTNIEDIINNLVTISQSKATAMAKDPIPMSYTIQKIFREGLLLYESTDCEYHFGQLLPLWGEKSTLYQVFLNIINNAIKYSSTQDKPQIWIDSTMDEQHVSYTVKDNGIGIPSETLPHIFDIFTRAANAQSFKGTGIGLALVKRIMDRLGGTIDIQSTEGVGTSIKLYFPIVSAFPPSML